MTTHKQLYYEKMFKLLANKRRLAIIGVLMSYQHASVGFIAEKINLSFKSTSKHLLLLENGNLVRRAEDGNFRVYTINRPKDRLMQHIVRTM